MSPNSNVKYPFETQKRRRQIGKRRRPCEDKLGGCNEAAASQRMLELHGAGGGRERLPTGDFRKNVVWQTP